MGKEWKQCQTLVLGAPKSLQMAAITICSDFGAPKITADGDCSHEIKRCLLLERKVMTNLDSILKSRDITLPTKVHLALTRWTFVGKAGTLLCQQRSI